MLCFGKMKHVLYITIVFCIFYREVEAQNRLRYRTENGDTIYFDVLKDVTVIKFRAKKDYRKYKRMVYNLRKVYPYAKIAKRKLAEMDNRYLTLKTDKERKTYIKSVEKELLSEFEAPLRKLTVSQGGLLIKLIDRETGKTSYGVIKEFKGGFSATLWQGVARLFGNNLKASYDAEGDDKILEELMLMYENGTFDQLYFSMFFK